MGNPRVLAFILPQMNLDRDGPFHYLYLFRDSCLFCRRLQYLRAEAIRPNRKLTEGPLTAEDPVLAGIEGAYCMPSKQSLDSDLIEWQRLLRDLRLAGTACTIDK